MARPSRCNDYPLGSIWFPSSTTPNATDPFYDSGPTNYVPPITPYLANGTNPSPADVPQYVPDMTNNPLHGFESFRIPNQAYTPPIASRRNSSAVPRRTRTTMRPPAHPTQYPTYDSHVNAKIQSDGLNEADEMNLYQPYPLLDSPFGPGDLEWLYRQQDVDGASLTSRLSSLAPISFTNTIDGPRRRKLFALDSWDMNNFVWANDNPGNNFPTNSRFTAGASAGFVSLNVPASTNSIVSTLPLNPTWAPPAMTPSLAQRDKKINLNYPLPVSNDPNEPIRQKWINDTYLLLKSILPPKAVDTAEELAQLSQYVINIIDFRDPDCTMTHWVNPDVLLQNVLPATGARSHDHDARSHARVEHQGYRERHHDHSARSVRHGIQPGRHQ